MTEDKYKSKSEMFRSKGWKVYCQSGDGSDNPDYSRKKVELRRILPDRSVGDIDFILCANSDDIRGLAQIWNVNTSWTRHDKWWLNKMREAIDRVDVFFLAGESGYDTYINGEYYGLLCEPLTPDEVTATVTSRRARKSFQELISTGMKLNDDKFKRDE